MKDIGFGLNVQICASMHLVRQLSLFIFQSFWFIDLDVVAGQINNNLLDKLFHFESQYHTYLQEKDKNNVAQNFYTGI